MKVAIVGAGLIGLATAVALRHEGHEVVVIDPDPGGGATHHAGGMLAPAAEMVYQQEGLFPLMAASASWYPELLGLVEAGRPTGYRAEGTVVVGADRADAQHVRELAELQRKHGIAVQAVTTRQVRALEPGISPRIAGAVVVPGDHQVIPRVFANSLIQQLGDAVVRQKAVRIDGATVVMEDGHIAADQVVVANGVAAQDMLAPLGLHVPLRPVLGDIVRLRVPAGREHVVSRVVRGFVADRAVYIIPRSDGTLAIGATSREDGREQPQAGGVYDLMRDAIRIVPGLEDYDFVEATAGVRPGTPDDLPYLGRVNQHVVVSTGYFRHGILLAALAARVGCELVAGRQASINIAACSPFRFSKSEGES